MIFIKEVCLLVTVKPTTNQLVEIYLDAIDFLTCLFYLSISLIFCILAIASFFIWIIFSIPDIFISKIFMNLFILITATFFFCSSVRSSHVSDIIVSIIDPCPIMECSSQIQKNLLIYI